MRVSFIDRYIVKQFVRNLLFALLCFTLIFILVDLFENIDRFIDNKLGFDTISSYYLSFIPEIIKLITPISMLLATLFTIGMLINFNEIVAIKNAGISLTRFMIPFLTIGLIVTAISLYFNNWVVPEANKKKFFIERNLLKRNIEVAGLNKLYFQDSPHHFIFIDQFNDLNLQANKVSILVYNPDTATKLIKRVDAQFMKWTDNRWVMTNAVERTPNSNDENLKTYPETDPSLISGVDKINLKPDQIINKRLKPDELNYSELNSFIDNQIKGGHNINKTLVDFYSKISFPFSSLIVIIFGISISTGSKRRKGLALQFGISILISFVYLGFVKISQTFGYNGDLNPLFTAWLANLVFIIFGGLNLYLKNY